MITRRNILLASTAMPLVAVAGCSQQSIDIIATVSQFIQKVQEGVVAACAAIGKYVPTVDYIMAVVVTFIGGALVPATLLQAVAVIGKVVDAIAAQCQAQQPSEGGLKKFY